jgi:hypothetical protein
MVKVAVATPLSGEPDLNPLALRVALAVIGIGPV